MAAPQPRLVPLRDPGGPAAAPASPSPVPPGADDTVDAAYVGKITLSARSGRLLASKHARGRIRYKT
ncbi:hypothetical protein WJX75_007702 [Coccomyxa subellipsoidea]|uniref:Uncharacterized protein n=1 Tax=Coccomyxa subellipsoidea TaxID=248742 RepID=A0ABR2YFD9_9CHLO